ncbi:hypothetical protein DCAR_0622861 [Daucus carota subsp. sativus]|uniref:Indole-3-acetic acid-amido synthetase GH3.6-like n=1 Tax=Daucus carota subsp. sativus TaxID=79200 RepID=A0AAF0X8Z8_DAUCS|nr:hypothetical protein DCAR_0622861 [Daucus carota subsp. sativus]
MSSETLRESESNEYTIFRLNHSIEYLMKNADEVQKRVLYEILSRNAGVEYLQRHGLGGRTDTHSFKKCVPLITYEDIQPDINRIANGDKSPILCSQPISEFLTSSGTSGGERKLIPTIEEELDRKSSLNRLLMPIMNQCIPGIYTGKAMNFIFLVPESRTPGGILAQPLSTSYNKNTQLVNYTSTNEAIYCLDGYQSMYSQMLCGLCLHKEVVRFLETNWTVLCNDIRTGTLNPEITDQLVRESVLTRVLKPDPVLADFIEAECSKKSWKGIITRLWPNTKCIQAIVTGTMSQYIPTLEYYANGLPIVSSLYASSECCFALNLDPLCKPSDISYTFIPTMAFFEFLPVRGEANSSPEARLPINEKKQQELVDLVDVKLGEIYEPVVTTYAGLYRYRVGDLLRVAGFKNKAPHFNFVCRKNVALSIDVDKTYESELHSAVVKAEINHLRPLDGNLIDYTAYADINTIPGHYVIFWEYIMYDNGSITTSQVIPPCVFEDCCLTIEESLNSVYREGRVADKTIGPLEIKIVEKGTFNELMDYAISLGAAMSQYKTPRSLKFAPFVHLLNSKVVASYYSPKCPSWTPK